RRRRDPARAAQGPRAQALARSRGRAEGPARRRPAARGRRVHAARPGRRADPGAGVPRHVHAGRRVPAARTLGLLVPRAAPTARALRPRRARTLPEARPPFVQTVADAIAPHGGTVRTFVMDEARLGQQGTLTRVWARTGSRPTAVKQTKYEWVYLYAAVEPATGASVALLAPNANTGTMSVFLKMLSADLKEGEHAVLILDGAGW